MKILVVDDDESHASMLKDALEMAGNEVYCRFDPVSAMVVLRDRKPDLVCLDIEMPAGGGRTFYSALRGNTITGNLPVVVITGIQDPAQAWAALGTSSHPRTWMLHKPLDPGAFARMVAGLERNLLGG